MWQQLSALVDFAVAYLPLRKERKISVPFNDFPEQRSVGSHRHSVMCNVELDRSHLDLFDQGTGPCRFPKYLYVLRVFDYITGDQTALKAHVKSECFRSMQAPKMPTYTGHKSGRRTGLKLLTPTAKPGDLFDSLRDP